jgi:hypothetical protein
LSSRDDFGINGYFHPSTDSGRTGNFTLLNINSAFAKSKNKIEIKDEGERMKDEDNCELKITEAGIKNLKSGAAGPVHTVQELPYMK